jgi:hypothetical protein
MAVTVNIISRDKTAQRKIVYGTVALDSSYPTNGEPCAQSVLGLGQIDHIEFTNANGYRPQYDFTNEKIKVYTSAGTETTNATDLSAITLRYKAMGK